MILKAFLIDLSNNASVPPYHAPSLPSGAPGVGGGDADILSLRYIMCD